jgi:hypothetical protein
MRRKLTYQQKMIRALERRKRAYEKYFKDLKDVDNQAQTAYTNIIKTLAELDRKSSAEVADPAEMQRKAREILESEYGITRGD